VRRQTRLADPLIDLRLFRARAFSASLIVYTVAILVVFGTFLFVFQYLQLVAGLSPFEAGLWSLPSFAAFVLGSLVSPALVRRIRPGFVMVIGAAPPARAGAASAISETGSELGGALSIAILGTLGTAVYRSQVDDRIPAGVPPEQADATRETLGAAEAAGDESVGVPAVAAELE
jgi:MFS transporter, DHA2 family, multidrug resistance protein